jgi:hypothetical protein
VSRLFYQNPVIRVSRLTERVEFSGFPGARAAARTIEARRIRPLTSLAAATAAA